MSIINTLLELNEDYYINNLQKVIGILMNMIETSAVQENADA